MGINTQDVNELKKRKTLTREQMWVQLFIMEMMDLVDTLEYELAQPPAKAGLRLIGEHLLAGLYGVSRMKARRSLDVLVRRHGSGTYSSQDSYCSTLH